MYAAHNVGFGAFGFGGVMFQNIFYVVGNAAMVVESLFGFDSPNLLVFNIVFHTHCADIVDMKFEHVTVADGVDDGVGVQFVAKKVGGGLARRSDVFGKNWRSCKSKHHITLEFFYNHLVHIAKLRAVALVENQHHATIKTVETVLRTFFIKEYREFLDCGDDYMALAVV